MQLQDGSRHVRCYASVCKGRGRRPIWLANVPAGNEKAQLSGELGFCRRVLQDAAPFLWFVKTFSR